MASEQPKVKRRRSGLRTFVLQVLSGALATILGAIFLDPVQEFLLWAAARGTVFNRLVVQANELPAGAVRLNVGEVSRFLEQEVTVVVEGIREIDGRPVAQIKISVPNRDDVWDYLAKGQDIVFVFRNAKYALKVMQLMPEDETVDVQVRSI